MASHSAPGNSPRTLLGQYFALTSLVFAIPVLQITSRAPEFFVAHGLQGANLVVFLFALSVLPPLVLAGLAWTATKLNPLGRWLHIGQLFALLFLLSCEALTPGIAGWVVPGALIIAAVGSYLYLRQPIAPKFLGYMSITPQSDLAPPTIPV